MVHKEALQAAPLRLLRTPYQKISVEHRTQIGDLSVFQDKPIITINDNVNADTKFTNKFGYKKTSNSRKE